MPPSVLHLSTYATNGGAARAGTALHEAMLAAGMDSQLWTAGGVKFKASRYLDRQLWRIQKSPLKTWRSPARFGSLTASEINASSADIVNLHWVTDGFLSIEEIGKITKPIVWSLYDMWAFSGTEHYGETGPDARWRVGYDAANRPPGEGGLDVDRHAWQRKLRSWGPMHLVPASTWLETCTSTSALTRNWPITRIPHVIHTEIFAPTDMERARKALGINVDGPVVLFLASAGIRDDRKGFDLLEDALCELAQHGIQATIAVAGPKEVNYKSRSGLPILWTGEIVGSLRLRDLYCAADVVAIPSREDNMPLTAMEAQACGIPVVAFDVGGLADIVQDGVTGRLVPKGRSDEFARALCNTISHTEQRREWGCSARNHALASWSPAVVVEKYSALYHRVFE